MSGEQIRECLADAGCGKELIRQFEACRMVMISILPQFMRMEH